VKKILTLLFFLSSFTVYGQQVKVHFLIGDVHVRESVLQKEWNKLTLNQDLNEKEIVKTGNESRCELLFPDGSKVSILSNSMMQIKDVAHKNNRKTNLFTLLGSFYFKVKKALGDQFRIKSPSSVAAIRGTEFMLINKQNQSELLVKSGTVEFSDINESQKVIVNSGQKSIIKSGGFPSQPMELSEAEKSALDKLSGSETQYEDAGEKQEQPQQTEVKEPPDKNTETAILANTIPPTPQEEGQPESSGKGIGMKMGLSLGAVTIDNQIYNQIGLRPEFTYGKLGVMLDLTIYLDQDGNIRKENWDSFDDLIEKFYYVRWAQKGDPFYAKVGAIDNYRLGYGILMNHYYNTIEYPTVIRTGLETGIKAGDFGFDMMVNDFKELSRPGGLFAGRISYRLFDLLEIGFSMVYDRNQFASLDDADNDGVPDALDDFPNNKKYAVDTDGDGVPDLKDPDRDGDGYTDNYAVIPDSSYFNDDDFSTNKLKPTPFNIKSAKQKDQIAFAVDLALPVVNTEYLQLLLYTQAAQFGYGGGWGASPLGFLAKFAFIDLYGEYRIFDKKFIPEYFNTTYELERAFFLQDTTGNLQPFTKRQLLELVNENLQGFVIGADFNLWDWVIFGAEYQNMSKSIIKFKTFRSHIDLNTTIIPKVNSLGAYYYQQNADELFKKTEGTILGYRFSYEIASGASLILDYRQTYRDVDGNGKISGSDEVFKTTNIQTVFTF